MRIVAIRERTVPLSAPMRNASVAFDSMTASLLAVISDRQVNGRPVIGYAFDSIGRYGKGGLLRDRFIPRLLAADSRQLLDDQAMIDPDSCVAVLMQNEKDGGHGERPGAVGLIDAALWDLRAKLEDRPLWRVLADRAVAPESGSSGTLLAASPDAFDAALPGASAQTGTQADGSFELYGSCGHFRPGRGTSELAGLADEVRSACDAGFTTVKIKLGGNRIDDDVARTEAALRAARAVRIAVDVNGRLDADLEPAWLRSMAALGVAWVEEPAPALDYQRLAHQAAFSALPIATGENLFSFDDARNLLRYGGLRAGSDLIQLDISLSYGIAEYRRILGEFEDAGWSRRAFMPHAGHLFAAHVVAGLGLGMHESACDASLPFSGLWDGTHIGSGRALASHAPGVGFEQHSRMFDWLRPLGEA